MPDRFDTWQDAWEWLKDRWESDQVWREQIILAVIVAAVGLAGCLMEIGAKRAWLPAG